MEAKLFKPMQIELELDTHEQVQVTPTKYGFTFDTYSIWSEAFEAYLKQDLNFLMHNYASNYESILERIEKLLNERGPW